MDLAALGSYCQDLGPIFSQYGPCAWLIRYMYGLHVVTTFKGNNGESEIMFSEWMFSCLS